MGGGSVKGVQSKAELDNVIRSGAPVILHFWASWCEASKHMDQVFSHLSTDFPQTHFFRVEAEEQPEISETYSVSAVPYFIFFKIPLERYLPTWRGNVIDAKMEMNPSRVLGMSLSVNAEGEFSGAKSGPGDFRVKIDWIKAMRTH